MRKKKPPPSFEEGTLADLNRGRARRRFEGDRDLRRSLTPEHTSRGLSRPRLERRRFEHAVPTVDHRGEIHDWLHQPREEPLRMAPDPDGILPTDHEGPAGRPPLISRGKAVELTDAEGLVGRPPLISRGKAVILTDIGESDATVFPPLRKMRRAVGGSPVMMRRQNAPIYTAGETETEAPYERLVATPWKPSLPVSADEMDTLLAQVGKGTKSREEVYVPASVWDMSTDADSQTSEAGSAHQQTWNLDLPSNEAMPEIITLRDPKTGEVVGIYNLNRGNGREMLIPAVLQTPAPEGQTSEGEVVGTNNLTVAMMFHEEAPPILTPYLPMRPATTRTMRPKKAKKSRGPSRRHGLPMPHSTRSEPAKKRRRHHPHRNHGAMNNGYERYPMTNLQAAVRSPPKLPAFAPPVFLEGETTENEAGPCQWVSFTERPATPVSPTQGVINPNFPPIPINVTNPTIVTSSNKPMRMEKPAVKYTFAETSVDGITMVCQQKSPEDKLFCTLQMARAGG